MNIESLKVGATVRCPADRGQSAYTGKVESFGDAVSKNIAGTNYVWVTVRHPSGSASVWPSNRIA